MTMNNSEILFLYDAKMTNPNGNVDDENRPRMDYESKRNLVSDVRLKRYIRDYLDWQGKPLYVGKLEGKTVNAEQRLEPLISKLPGKVDKKSWSKENEDWLLDQLIDVRLFGATMAVKGLSLTFTGPVQFSWGYSLNPVNIMESTITTHFSSTGTQEQGTMGRDYRVVYSFLSFYGLISGKRAQKTRLTDEDVQLLDEALVKSIPLMATRSKIGQAPRLYMRVEYIDDMTMVGDWRDRIEPLGESLKQINDVELHADRLIAKLEQADHLIHSIHLWEDTDLKVSANGITGSFSQLLPPALQNKIQRIGS
jgi:CRISPR-associated protein Csh2